MDGNTLNGGGEGDNANEASFFGQPFAMKNKNIRSKTSIPRPKTKTKSKQRSVIYTSYPPRNPDHTASAISTLGHFRSPWVPAPGKTTTAMTGSVQNRKPQQQDSIMNILSSSSSSILSYAPPPKSSSSKGKLGSKFVSSKTKTNHASGSATNQMKNESSKKAKKNRPSSGYTLKSKDSLVDVTAFLHSKREEIMKLWQDNLLNDDADLLSKFEKANTLAIDATQEVEILRKSIQDLYEKDSSLSEGDCDMLDELRKEVLTKVKAFEEVNAQVHKIISDHISSKTVISTAASRSTSGAALSADAGGRNVINQDVIFLKQKSPTFRDLEDSEFEGQEIVQEFKSIPKQPMGATTTTSNTTTKTASTAPSTTVDLSKLTQLYAEKYEFPPVQSEENRNFRSSSRPSKNRFVRFQQENDYTFCPGEIQICNEENQKVVPSQVQFYREKVNEIQRHLLETEAEMEEMKGDLQRVESDSNFKVRMLKSKFEDRLDVLESFPEYLQITEKRLFDTMESKVQLERAISEKDHQIVKLNDAGENLKKEINELKDKLRTSDNSKEFMTLKITELESRNQSLRRDLDEKNSQIDKLTQKVESLSIHTNTRPKFWDHDETQQQPSFQNERLEIQCADLKDRLEKALKSVQILQISKKKLSNRCTKRQEEILEELELSRAKNRQLQAQIQYIKTTYYELFPKELFYPSKNILFKDKKVSKKRLRSKVTLQDPLDEPLVTKTTTWQTGQGHFIDQENDDDDDDDGSGTYTVEDYHEVK